ncbi:hypothetical protein IWQ62_002188 [Dispira parvispora]|uniref:Altered inheritance of mitochondria protein 41 n=1 Tax=Dispira parvispora TaxID=1520584 RepID=A0A9W8E2Z0_9FUNG|nr:hypothetical protein IWQ62_002188 [Dispira parvispora]
MSLFRHSQYRLLRWATLPSAPLVPKGFPSTAFSMPTLLSKLKTDMKASMRNKDQNRLTVIRSILSEVLYAEKALLVAGKTGAESKTASQTDESVVNLIHKAIKKRNDAIAVYQGANRPELAEKEAEQVTILQSFLPEPYSEKEVEAFVLKAIKECGASSIKDLGKVMKAVTLDPTRAPKSQVAGVAKRLLTKSK